MLGQRGLFDIKDQLHRGRGFIDMLAAGATGTNGLPVQLCFVDGDSGGDLNHKKRVSRLIGRSVTGVVPRNCG